MKQKRRQHKTETDTQPEGLRTCTTWSLEKEVLLSCQTHLPREISFEEVWRYSIAVVVASSVETTVH